jgi:hypothetical protein
MPHRRAVSKGNGRLDHGEAPGMTRICRKTPVIPETVLWAALRDAGPEGSRWLNSLRPRARGAHGSMTGSANGQRQAG